VRRRWQKLLFLLVACVFRERGFFEAVLAKAEYARFRANMSEAGAQRRLRVAGIQGEPLARFLGSFFAAWQRMNIKKPTASAHSSVSAVGETAKNLV